MDTHVRPFLATAPVSAPTAAPSPADQTQVLATNGDRGGRRMSPKPGVGAAKSGTPHLVATKKQPAKKQAPKKKAASKKQAPLAEYTAKRDFAKTAEPAGAPAAEPSATGSSCNGTEPARCTTTSASRWTACSRAGRSRRARRSTQGQAPRCARRGPPGRVLRLRRCRSRAASTAAATSSSGTGAPTSRPHRRSGAAVADGELHVDLLRREAARPFRDDPARTRPQRQGAVARLPQERRIRGSGWDAEEFPQSVRSGRTNDEVKAEPDAVWRSDAPAASSRASTSPRPAPTSPPSTRWARRATGSSTASPSSSRTSTRCSSRGAHKREKPFTKRDLIRYYAMVAPVMVPYLEGRPLNMHRFPNGVDKPGFWHKSVTVARAGMDHAVALRRRRRRRDGVVHRRRPSRHDRVARELRRGRAPRVDVAHPEGAATDLRADRRRSGREDDVGRRS